MVCNTPVRHAGVGVPLLSQCTDMSTCSGEEKPVCLNCRRQNEPCDYSIRLNWGGRKRMPSVDCPSSQSSPQSAQLLFALSPPDGQQDSTDNIAPVGPLGVAEGGNVHDQDMENLCWESEFAQVTATGASFRNGLHDTQGSPAVTEQPSRVLYRTDDKTAVKLSPSSEARHVATLWPSLSQAPLSCETTPGHSSSFAPPFDTVPYPSPADTGPSIGALANVNWSSATISQPISFLRQSADKHGSMNGYGGQLETSVSHTGVDHGSPSYSSQSPSSLEHLSPDSKSRAYFLPTTSNQRGPGLLANTPASSEDFLATTKDASLQSPQIGACDSSGTDASSDTPLSKATQELNDPSGSTSSERQWHTYLRSVTDNYGMDCGRPDLDTNQNDDHSAIDINYALSLLNPRVESLSDTNAPDPPEKEAKTSCLEGFAYYKSSVPINIPRYLSPLPITLVQTPINLMYFHHFLNHTARMLVPHDCDNNPFVTVLPSSELALSGRT